MFDCVINLYIAWIIFLCRTNMFLMLKVSDDEDEDWFTIHPQSRLRQIRLERMEKHKKEVEKLEKKKVEHNKKMSEIKEKLSEARLSVAALERELKELEKEGDSFQKMEEELREKEVKAPLNTDTISKPGFSKTVINTSTSAPTEKEIFYSKQKFIEEHEEKVRHYGMLRRYDESRAYLKAHDYLVCQSTADYLISWCAVLEVGHQVIIFLLLCLVLWYLY